MSIAKTSSVLAAQTVWAVDRIKDHTVKIGSGVTPSGGATSYLDSGIPLLRSQNVHFDGLRLDDVAFISEETHNEMSGTKLRERDVLLNITGASIGRCSFVPSGFGEGNVNQHVCIIRLTARLNYKFLTYCLSAPWGQDQILSSFTGASRQGLGQRDLGEIMVPLPPLSDQQRIAAYLDSSCAAIDAAVAAKRRQLETLDALRKTIIHNVITRGVNAEFDESIVGRIEKIPHSWKKVKMFRICQKISSGGTPSTFNLDYYGGNIPWVQTGDLNDGYVEMTEKTITELGLQESAARIYPEGTLLMAMYGATIGKLGILKNPSATNQACCAMKLRNDVDNRFVFYLLRDFRPTLISMSYGGGQPNISQETIKQLYFFLPPFHEQRKISQHLDIKTSTIESIKAGIESQISTLTTYRKSLIHECVTGQRRVTEADVARARREKEAN